MSAGLQDRKSFLETVLDSEPSDPVHDLASIRLVASIISRLLMASRRSGTQLPSYDGFTLGGPLNLSGFQDNQLVGTGVKLGRLVYYYRLGQGGCFVSAYYAGASLEAGNVTDRLNGPSLPGLVWVSAVFVGADSVLGPLYLAAGYAKAATMRSISFWGGDRKPRSGGNGESLQTCSMKSLQR
jgi:hypothetical protein